LVRDLGLEWWKGFEYEYECEYDEDYEEEELGECGLE